MKTEISGDGLILKRFEAAFASALYEAASESCGGEFSRWMPWCHENYSFADSESFARGRPELWEQGSAYVYAIFDHSQTEFLGMISLNQFQAIHKFVNLGYWIRVSQQQRGIASRATRLLAKTAFEILPINRIEILTAAGNLPSQKTAERAGAGREGILR